MNRRVLRWAAAAAGALPASVRQLTYRLGPLTRAIRRLLNRAAPSAPTEVRVAAGELAGARLVLDLRSEKDLWLGTYEPDLQACLRAFVRSGSTAYDLGANLGYVTLLLARAVGHTGRVLAFEPLPANLERLRTHLALNGCESWVQVVPAAVGERTGRARFWLHASKSMGKLDGSAGRDQPYPHAIDVEAVDLDTFVYARANPAPDLVKMDLEGGEVLAFAGMRRVLRDARPTLLVELHGPEAIAAAWEVLPAAGYRIHQMRRGYPLCSDPARLGWKSYVVARHPARPGG